MGRSSVPDPTLREAELSEQLARATAENERQRILERSVLKRIGEPDDIAGAVEFLATAPYVTGQIIAVDGGRSIVL